MKHAALAFILFASLIVPVHGQRVVGKGHTLGGGHHLIRICPQLSIAAYIAMAEPCAQPPSFDIFTGYSCTSTPSSICTNLGVNGANINMLLDPNGGHTFLFQATGGVAELWNVTAGQSVHVTVTGKIWGATKNDTWPHFDAANSLTGQTGDATEENKVTVVCGASCAGDGRNGISDILCNAAVTGGIECVNQLTDVYITPYGAQFTAAPASAPYDFTIELIMNGGTNGTATIKSMGIHLL